MMRRQTNLFRFLGISLAAMIVLAGCAPRPKVYRHSSPPAPAVYSVQTSTPKPYKVLGHWYTPLASSAGFVQTGMASWYGGKFHGRKTANGETYNKHAMTAAHKRLPLGTCVKVVNQKNRRSVVVRINDRGPFAKGRIIDLSYAAAQKLDVVSSGTAPVKIFALGAPGRSKTVSPGNGASPNNFAFQVGSFGDRANAEKVKVRLSKKYKSVRVVPYSQGGATFYRVRVGHYLSRTAIENDRPLMINDGFENVTIVTE